MRATGIIRRIDDLGRVVIPKEIRHRLHIREGDPLEIFTTSEGGVVFQRYRIHDSTRRLLADLQEQIDDEYDSEQKKPLLRKIRELEDLLKAEQDRVDGGERQ